MNKLTKAALVGAALVVPTAIALSPTSLAGEATTKTAEQTTTFNVENMTCGLCPITVRKAIEKVDGVKSVAVDLDSQTATVTYDPSLTTQKAIGAASTDAGYPATPTS